MAENENRPSLTPRPRVRAALGRVVGILIVVVAIVLAVLPYLLIRGPVDRIMQRLVRHRS